MQVAEVLSDLTSLRDHNDALALVTVNETLPSPLSRLGPGAGLKTQPSDSETTTPGHAQKRGPGSDDHLQRAKELVDLHHELKARHADGTVDEELAMGREDVNRVLRELGSSR